MANTIIGIYDSPEETIKAIENLNTKGLASKDIFVITNQNDEDYLETITGTNVEDKEAIQMDQDKHSIWDTLKEYLRLDENTGQRSGLNDMDIPKSELERYNNDLENGKYLIATDKSQLLKQK